MGATWASFIDSIQPSLSAFGQLCGAGWFVSALLSQIQNPIISSVTTYLDGNFFLVNLAMAGFTLLGLLPVLALFIKETRKAKLRSAHKECVLNEDN